jgi:hypothetical protein
VRRQVVEHRIARLVQLGIRQARYVGRTKTLFQLLLAAAVANLTLLATAPPGGTHGVALAGACLALAVLLLGHGSRPDCPAGPNHDARWLAGSSASSALSPASARPTRFRMPGFRPDF